MLLISNYNLYIVFGPFRFFKLKISKKIRGKENGQHKEQRGRIYLSVLAFNRPIIKSMEYFCKRVVQACNSQREAPHCERCPI